MAPVEPASEQQNRPARFAQRAFCALVIMLALFQFSENTADPDLWGHVFFGRVMLEQHAVPRAEIYSWTDRGHEWINHEWLAGVFLAAIYGWLGGSGILLLKVAMGMLTFLLSLRLGSAGLNWPGRFAAWAIGALAVVEISYGFPARPQIFTALCLVIELILLRRIHSGSPWWALAFPPLFAFWINVHGGVLAGVGLLGVVAVTTTGSCLLNRFTGKFPLIAQAGVRDDAKTAGVLWLALAGAIGSLFINPWGSGLVHFLVKSIFWMRPEIEEWNPTPFGWDHAAAFILMGVAAFAWAFTQRRRSWWELAVCAAFAVLALRAVRNTPLFAIVALSLVPPHFASALQRFRAHLERWEELCRCERTQKFAGTAFLAIALAVGAATFTLHKEHPLTMSVPRAEYPVSAIAFIREHELRGKLVVFFDWGEMTIFHLPDCPPSIDPRLDTCYSRELIAAHWHFYNGEPFDEKIFNPFDGDLALLPVKQVGAVTLSRHPGWKAVYYDETAVLLVKDAGRFPKLSGLTLPVAGAKDASTGRAVFGTNGL